MLQTAVAGICFYLHFLFIQFLPSRLKQSLVSVQIRLLAPCGRVDKQMQESGEKRMQESGEKRLLVARLLKEGVGSSPQHLVGVARRLVVVWEGDEP